MADKEPIDVSDLDDGIAPIKPLTDAEVLAWALGDHRTPEQIAKDGARANLLPRMVYRMAEGMWIPAFCTLHAHRCLE